MATQLLYLQHMNELSCGAEVKEIKQANDKTLIILDRTVFYPQGGGQPYDTGKITSSFAEFIVTEVRIVEGAVAHFGSFESGTFQAGDTVTCKVDAERRFQMSRLHSAGHVVDMAVQELGLNWFPGKGFHFPEGSYVEYKGDIPPQLKETLPKEIEQIANRLIQQQITVTIQFMSKEKMTKMGHFVPDYLPENKPVRIVYFGDFGIPCGGTHVPNLSEVGSITIRKIKPNKGTIRVSYAVDS